MLKTDYLKARREGLTCVLGRAGTRTTPTRMVWHLYNSLEISKVLACSMLEGVHETKRSNESEPLKRSLKQM